MHKPWWRLFSIDTIRSELWAEVPAGAGIDGGGIEVGGAEVEVGAEEGAVVDASDGPLALALRVPGKVMMGSSRFEQFFFI